MRGYAVDWDAPRPNFSTTANFLKLEAQQLTAIMGKPKRNVLAAAEESMTPPDQLTDSQSLARVVKAEGNNLYSCQLPNKKPIVVELEPRFRNTIWIKRGGYVLVDLASADERPKTSRVVGEIINVVRDEKEWRKQPYWFVTSSSTYRGLLTIVGPNSFQRTRTTNPMTKSRR